MVKQPARAAALLVALVTTACDFPTSLPRFETRIAMPLEETRLVVSELAPANVTVTPGSFQIDVSSASASRSLAQMCGAPCTAVQGQQVPKPAFTDVFGVAAALPGDVVSATLLSGTARVTVAHTFAFDPLRPPGSTQNGCCAWFCAATAASSAGTARRARSRPPSYATSRSRRAW
jgi:hypothetical protein